jgi:methyltransferase (TIGR00027 family)
MKNEASATALLVATGVAFQSTHPRFGELVPPAAGDLSRRLVAAAAGGRRVYSGSSVRDRLLVSLQERLFVPGLTLHYVLRKLYIEQLVRDSLEHGFEQLIVLGAGLDTLGMRLRAITAANVVEVDHPATQQFKREIMERAGVGGEGITYVPVDLTKQNLTEALVKCEACRPDRWTVFLAEGVFLYLSASEVHDTLRQMRAYAQRTRVVFTFCAPRHGRAINFQNATWLADQWLALRGEPGRWAIEPADLAAFLLQDNFKLLELARDDEYHRRYVDDPSVPLARGEHIAMADAEAAGA